MTNTSGKPIEWSNAEYHRKEILSAVAKIKNPWILWQIHQVIINITEEE